jgi:asparagine synthase (glutamine-hydrolysing)
MCGITGWISGTADSPDREVLARMTRALAHRGPDAEGVVIEGAAGLGHRRLAIIDLSTDANQPMRDASGRYLIVFNGEIYNFAEVRRELETRGHCFATRSDTEVLLEAIKAWGPGGARAFERHVRAGVVGQATPNAAAGPRPAREEAFVLRTPA